MHHQHAYAGAFMVLCWLSPRSQSRQEERTTWITLVCPKTRNASLAGETFILDIPQDLPIAEAYPEHTRFLPQKQLFVHPTFITQGGFTMLVLSRRVGESIIIGNDIRVTILKIKNSQVKLGIDAPTDLAIHRSEYELAETPPATSSITSQQDED